MPKLCQICGEPMPPGEEVFNYHGYSGDCPKPPLPKEEPKVLKLYTADWGYNGSIVLCAYSREEAVKKIGFDCIIHEHEINEDFIFRGEGE